MFKETITISLPNRDILTHSGTLFPKQVLHKSYLEKIGQYINILGVDAKLEGVTMNENSINLIVTLSVEDLSKFEHGLCRTHIKPK